MLDLETIQFRISELTEEQVIGVEPPFYLNEKQKAEIPKLFWNLMKEENNKNKSIKEQYSLLDNIIEALASGQTREETFREYGRNKHMYAYDTFLGKGEAQKIEDILASYGLGVDVLKGIPLPSEFNNQNLLNGRLGIYEHLSDEGDRGESPVIEDFVITYMGTVIYSYHYDFNTGKVDINTNEAKNITQPKKQTKSKYKGRTLIDFGNNIISEVRIWEDKNGKISYRDSKGHFVRRR